MSKIILNFNRRMISTADIKQVYFLFIYIYADRDKKINVYSSKNREKL